MNKQNTVTVKIAHTGDFATFGQSVVAYVRKIEEDGKPAFSIHGANGEQLAIEQSEEMALHTAQQMKLFPVMLQ